MNWADKCFVYEFPYWGGNRCSDSQSTAGRDGSVHDFLAGSGRVNRNGSDVLE